MIKKYPLLAIALLCSIFTSFGQVTDLIISEYGEGSGNAKFIEIYNGTGATIDLTNYALWKITNGGSWTEGTYLFTTTTLANGATLVIANNATEVPGADEYDATICSWNGDDAVGLAKAGTLIDAVGTNGPDPGSGWNVAGVTNATKNNRLTRKSTVCSPNINWTTSAGTNTTDSEWIVASYTSGSAGAGHTASCSSSTPTITVSTTSITGLDYASGSGPSAEQTFTVSGSNLTADISLTAPTNFEISTTSGSGFGTALTLTQSGGSVATTTIYTRLASGLSVNAYSGNSTASSTGATSANVSLSGSVTGSGGGGGCSELLISEYVEGSGNNKFIEIYNPTGATVTLTGVYDIQLYTNGSSTAGATIPLSGSIAAYGVFVLENTGETIGVTADQQSGSLGFNGDDAIVLRKSSTIIDVIGQIGFDPGSEWVGTTCTQGTKDGTLVRKSTIQSGDANGSDAFNPDTEWVCYAVDDVSNLGSHTSDCQSAVPTISVSTNSLVNLNYAVGSGPSAEQTFTVSGSNLTADITLTAPTNFEISTTSGSGFGASLVLAQAGGTVNTTTIYVRLKAALAVNVYTGDLTASSTGATTQNVTFNGEVLCVASHTISSFSPTLGPVGTRVTITGSGFTSSTTSVDFGGVVASVTYVNSTTLIVVVPSGADTFPITVTVGTCALDSSGTFTVITDNNCIGGSIPAGFSDLMFTGIYDDAVSSCHYFELLNPTALDIDLSTYTIGFDNNFVLGSAVPTSGFTGGSIALSGIIPAGTTKMIRVSASGTCNSCPTIVPDLTFVNGGINDQDRLVLLNGTTAVDVWQNHSNGTGYNKGYIFSRKNTATAPSTTFNLADWNTSATEDCFGFAISSAILPTINTHPADVTGCTTTATFSTSATAGNGGTLTYNWRYNDGTSTGWADVTSASFSPGVVTGETTASLSISGLNLDGYQFYCEVTEAGSCTVATNAALVDTQTTTWNGTSWKSGTPNISTTVIIDGSYSTASGGSFSSCSLFINPASTLTVGDGTFVEVQNDVFVSGSIVVETQGSFVQNNDAGVFTVYSGGATSVNKTTPSLNNWYEYVYWSSPVNGETVANALSIAPVSRRFYFNAANFVDLLQEVGNTGTFLNNPGVDDIDDNGDDWQYASGVMQPGVGYVATVNPTGFVAGTFQTSFNGAFNNGVIQTPVVNNSGGLYNDWNLIGNPYPGALDVSAFFTTNASVIGGSIYLWSQATPADVNASGNQGANFSNADYAVVTGSGVNTAGGDGVIPNSFIPSGQGFFVEAIAAGNVVFNNAMRAKTGNTQFFRNTESRDNANIIWINLTSDNGVFNQMAIAYIDGATDGNDGAFYDSKRNVSSGNAALLYSLIDGETTKYAVQGKSPKSLNLNEKVAIGIKTIIDVPTFYKLSLVKYEGDFFSNNAVYLRDKLFGLYHNLSESDYTFVTKPGEFNKRFEILFQKGKTNPKDLTSELSVTEFDNGLVQFSVTNNRTIKTVQIVDILGRTVYLLQGNSSTETYDISKLKKAVYFARVTLDNNEVIVQKAVKK